MLIALTSVVLYVSVFLVIPIGRNVSPTSLSYTIAAEVSDTPPSTFRKVYDRPFRTILLCDKIISSERQNESGSHYQANEQSHPYGFNTLTLGSASAMNLYIAVTPAFTYGGIIPWKSECGSISRDLCQQAGQGSQLLWVERTAPATGNEPT